MKIYWLGQAGLMIEAAGKTVIVDPYLSDSVEGIEPWNKRRVKADEGFLKIKPDVVVLTHNHLDHTDPQTLKHYLTDGGVTVLASGNAWRNIRSRFDARGNNFVMFNRGTQWTEEDITFKAVYAEHSDDTAIGAIIKAEGKTLYITGDTLYNDKVFADLPSEIDAVFLPINGVGNNMNMTDAALFCQRLQTKAVPLHFGLFDELDGNDLDYENKVVPEFYAEIRI